MLFACFTSRATNTSDVLHFQNCYLSKSYQKSAVKGLFQLKVIRITLCSTGHAVSFMLHLVCGIILEMELVLLPKSVNTYLLSVYLLVSSMDLLVI